MATLHPALILSSNITSICTPRWVACGVSRRAASICCSTVDSGGKDAGNSNVQAPWELTRYYTKKKGRPIDPQGNIIDSIENTADWVTWTPENKLSLAADALSTKLGKSAEELLANIEPLGALIPGGTDSLRSMKPADQIRLAAHAEHVPALLIALRDTLPAGIDVSKLVTQWPEVLLLSIEQVKVGYSSLREVFEKEFGEEGVCEMLETTPQLLDSTILQACLRGAGHLMPLRQLASSLARYGDYWMQFQSLEKEPRNDYDDTLADVNYYLSDNVKAGSG